MAKMSAKRELRVCISLNELEIYDFDGSITEIIEKLQKIKDKYESEGYYNISIDAEQGYEHVCFGVVGTRLETDKEVERRVEETRKERARKKTEKEEKEEKTVAEYEQYQKLHKKFGELGNG